MDTGEIVLALAAIAAGALIKTVTGVGFPLIAVPVITAFASVEEAVVVVAFPNLVANVSLSVRERRYWSRNPDLPVLAGTAFVGAVAGTFLLTRVPDGPLTLALAGLVGVYVVTVHVTPRLTLPARFARRASPVVGSAAGVAQGATGVSGPIVVTWTHAYRLPRDAFVASVTTIFGMSGVGQIVGIVADGSYDGGRLATTLAGVVPVLVAVPVGTRLRRMVSAETFENLVLGVLVVSAVVLVVEVVV